jgi:hypothetical protein
LFACLPKEYATENPIFSANWCRADIKQHAAALYSVRHSKKHIEVFLACKETTGIKSEIENFLPVGVTIKSRPNPRKGNWAKSTPFSLYIETEEQAQSMGPLLQYLVSHRTNSSVTGESAKTEYWFQPSESEGEEIVAGIEGNRVSVLVNRYERDPENRKSCIRHYGAVCKVCEFDFAKAYGEIGEGYIHVHHLTGLATLKGKARKFDPVKDMIPVCPNCHEMLHQCDPPYTIDQLKEIIANAKADVQKSSHP